jgi:hypothetical protein
VVRPVVVSVVAVVVVVMVMMMALVMAVVSGGIVCAVARRCDTGPAEHDRPGDAEQCDCA